MPLYLNRLGLAVLLALPPALVAYLSFQDGGFFVGDYALVAFFVLLMLVARTTLADHPFEGIGWRAGAVILLATGVAGWTLLSTGWSESDALPVLEFARWELYLGVLLLCASIAHSADRLRWLVRLLVVATAGIVLCGLITRALPEVWPTEPSFANNRLSYPLTYWNALGIIAALGFLLASHLTCSERESPWTRVAAAALLPMYAAGLYFTFSRGAMLAGGFGLVLYAVLARPRLLLPGVLAAVPPTVVAVVVSYGADALSTLTPTTPRAVDQGKTVALVVAVCMLNAAVFRLVLAVKADPALLRLDLQRILPRRRRRIGLLATGLVAVVAFLALGAPQRIADQYDGFVNGNSVTAQDDGDLRARLTDPGNNGRLDHWRVSVDAFDEEPLRGLGAGSYESAWERLRPDEVVVQDAHSLYVEILGELGIVGLVLMVALVLVIVLGVALRARGPDRGVYAAVAAALAVWVLHAGIDWDWEMPAVTVIFFALAGFGLSATRVAGPDGDAKPSRKEDSLRPILAIAWLLLAITPALATVWDSRIGASKAAFDRGDCTEARRYAFDAISTLASRPEPYEVIGYCDLADSVPHAAVRAMEEAVERDGVNWRYRYGLAVARAAAGEDPRPAAAEALRLNPRETYTRFLVDHFSGDDPDRWVQRAVFARRTYADDERVAGR